MGTIQRIQTLLVSVDGGMVWHEIPVSTNIRYDFTPIPNKVYRPMVRIKTVDITEVQIELFPNINGIIYKDIDYDSLVTDTIKRIADAYEGKNVGLFSDHVSRDFLGNKTFLIEGIRFDFDMFNDIRLVIFINRIEQRGSLFAVDTKWNKTQVPRSTGLQQRTSGNTTFVLVMEDGKMKIQNLKGNLIYATLSPEIAESSGLPQSTIEEIREANNTRTPVQPGAGETEETGGVSLALQTSNGSITSRPAAVHGFDFSSGSEVLQNVGDFNYVLTNRFNAVGAAQIQDVTGTSSFRSLNEAPSGGYAAFVANMAVGDTFVFITQEGFYGKMEVSTLTIVPGVNDIITFKYAVQTDGSRNISTQ